MTKNVKVGRKKKYVKVIVNNVEDKPKAMRDMCNIYNKLYIVYRKALINKYIKTFISPYVKNFDKPIKDHSPMRKYKGCELAI